MVWLDVWTSRRYAAVSMRPFHVAYENYITVVQQANNFRNLKGNWPIVQGPNFHTLRNAKTNERTSYVSPYRHQCSLYEHRELPRLLRKQQNHIGQRIWVVQYFPHTSYRHQATTQWSGTEHIFVPMLLSWPVAWFWNFKNLLLMKRVLSDDNHCIAAHTFAMVVLIAYCWSFFLRFQFSRKKSAMQLSCNWRRVQELQKTWYSM